MIHEVGECAMLSTLEFSPSILANIRARSLFLCFFHVLSDVITNVHGPQWDRCLDIYTGCFVTCWTHFGSHINMCPIIPAHTFKLNWCRCLECTIITCGFSSSRLRLL